MIPLTLDQRDYKERTLNQLLLNVPQMEAQLARETQRQIMVTLHEQLEAMEVHIVRLQQELANDVILEPVADELCRQAASALVKQKLFMARRYINKLEAIEPFYPELGRLKQEVESGQVSRRTRALSQSEVFPTLAAAANVPLLTAGPKATGASQAAPEANRVSGAWVRSKESGGLRQYFQFHIIASCLVIILLACTMASIGGMSVLRWLVEGS